MSAVVRGLAGGARDADARACPSLEQQVAEAREARSPSAEQRDPGRDLGRPDVEVGDLGLTGVGIEVDGRAGRRPRAHGARPRSPGSGSGLAMRTRVPFAGEQAGKRDRVRRRIPRSGHPHPDHRGSTSFSRTRRASPRPGRSLMTPAARVRRGRFRQRLEPVDELRLRLEQLHARVRQAVPARSIDLRELLQLPRAGRPLERERVAPELRIGSKSPSAHQAATIFPAFCRTVPRSTSASRSIGGWRAELLLELAQRNLERLLARARPHPSGSTRRRRPSAPRTARPDGRAAPRSRRCRGGRGEGRRSAWASCEVSRRRRGPRPRGSGQPPQTRTARRGQASCPADSPGHRGPLARSTSLPARLSTSRRVAASGRIARRGQHEHESTDEIAGELERTAVAHLREQRPRSPQDRAPAPSATAEPQEQPNYLVANAHPAAVSRAAGPDAPLRAGSPTVSYRVCGNPRSTLLVAGSGQRLVTTLPRV